MKDTHSIFHHIVSLFLFWLDNASGGNGSKTISTNSVNIHNFQAIWAPNAATLPGGLAACGQDGAIGIISSELDIAQAKAMAELEAYNIEEGNQNATE